MNHLQEQEQIERRMAHNRAKDKRRIKTGYICNRCSAVVNFADVGVDAAQAKLCAECYRNSNVEG